ncbi:MAG: response regulator transcription factor [Acidimicrobiia bacterium]
MVVADDSLLVREGVVTLLRSRAPIEVVGEAWSLDTLRAAVADQQPDVVVSDIRMPPTNTDEGIRFASMLRAEGATTGVVVLSQHAEAEYALRLFDSGAAGRAYLLKERLMDAAQIASAVSTVASGGTVMDPDVVAMLVRARSGASASPLLRLTPRELDVLSAMAEGKSNAGIAAHLVLSEGAVEKHINSILTKLDLPPQQELHRRVQAVLLYLANRRELRG